MSDVDISIIMGVKNDSYGGNYRERTTSAILRNLENFKKADFSYEFIVVDWNSPVPFNTIEPLSIFFSDSHVKTIYVPGDVMMLEGLNPNTYYEYFAKNVGLRNARGKYTLITNSDIFLSDVGVTQLGTLLKINLSNIYVRPPTRYRIDKDCIKEIEPLHLTPTIQGTDASGDFVLCLTDEAINKGRGFDESDIRHKTNLPHMHMDGEFVMNMYHNGMRPIIQEVQYYHIEHERHTEVDLSTPYWKPYENTETWGMVNYPHVYNKETNMTVVVPTFKVEATLPTIKG